MCNKERTSFENPYLKGFNRMWGQSMRSWLVGCILVFRRGPSQYLEISFVRNISEKVCSPLLWRILDKERGKNNFIFLMYHQYLKISQCLFFLHTVVAALWKRSPSFLEVWFLSAALALNSLYLDLFSVTLDRFLSLF